MSIHSEKESEQIINGLIYKDYKVDTKGNRYQIIVVKTVDTGILRYINIRKLTHNPFLTAGKFFYSFDEAVKNYKNPDLKEALLQIETGII